MLVEQVELPEDFQGLGGEFLIRSELESAEQASQPVHQAPDRMDARRPAVNLVGVDVKVRNAVAAQAGCGLANLLLQGQFDAVPVVNK